jgi:hypothetical protein
VKNIVDTTFFTPHVFAAGRLQTSFDRIAVPLWPAACRKE